MNDPKVSDYAKTDFGGIKPLFKFDRKNTLMERGVSNDDNMFNSYNIPTMSGETEIAR